MVVLFPIVLTLLHTNVNFKCAALALLSVGAQLLVYDTG